MLNIGQSVQVDSNMVDGTLDSDVFLVVHRIYDEENNPFFILKRTSDNKEFEVPEISIIEGRD